MAPGITGYVGGRPQVHPLIRLFSFLLPSDRVRPTVVIDDREQPVKLVATAAVTALPGAHPPPQPEGSADASVPLIALAWARSGDKGNHANIGVIARRPDYLPWIAASLTERAVSECFAHLLEGPAVALANNLTASLKGRRTRTFAYRAQGQFATIGDQRAVAEVRGLRFAGFFAWMLWRGVYLAKFPTFWRKTRIVLEWTWTCFFPVDIAHLGFTTSNGQKTTSDHDRAA